jgi:hypothetical protein
LLLEASVKLAFGSFTEAIGVIAGYAAQLSGKKWDVVLSVRYLCAL